MPRAIFAIWWDDTLGPMMGRSYPESEELNTDEVVVIFMGHGTQQEAKVGYTNLSKGLVISYLEPPNCIAVLLNDDDDSTIIERNLRRVVSEIDFNSDQWDDELQRTFQRLDQLITTSSTEELLNDENVARFIMDINEGRIKVVIPKHVLKLESQYPDAALYMGHDVDENERKLRDLASQGFIVPKTYGRKVECKRCGSSEVIATLTCPKCNSQNLYNVYSVYCPHCKELFHTVISDDVAEVACHHCKRPVLVSGIEITSVEPLCSDCGTATDSPKVTLTCGVCMKVLDAADLLGGTGLAYYPK